MPAFDKHIFVCTNQRPADAPRRSCDREGNGDLHRALKDRIARRGLDMLIRVNKAGCLDQCEHGPTVVVYPDAVWYGGVTEADLDEIVESHIAGGKPVERLRIAESCLNNPRCEHCVKK